MSSLINFDSFSNTGLHGRSVVVFKVYQLDAVKRTWVLALKISEWKSRPTALMEEKKIMVSPEFSAGAKCHCDGKTTTHMFLHKIIDSACLVTASWYRTYQADFFIPLHWRRNSFIRIATTPENMRYKLPDAKEATTTLCFIPSWEVWKVFKYMNKYKICR